MANIKIESVIFTGLTPLKGWGRTVGQIKAADAKRLEMTITEVDGLVLRLESPLGVQRVPMAQVRVATEAPVEEGKKKANG